MSMIYVPGRLLSVLVLRVVNW